MTAARASFRTNKQQNLLPPPNSIHKGELDERREDEPRAGEEPDLARLDVRDLGQGLRLRGGERYER